MDYIDRINQIVKEKNISQRQLAEKIGKPQGTIHNYLSRKTKMDVEILQKMAAALGVDLCWLLGMPALDENLKKVIYYLINGSVMQETIKTIASLVPDFFTKPKPFNQYPYETRILLFQVLAQFHLYTGIPCSYFQLLIKMGLLSKNYYTAICYYQKYQNEINDFIVEYMKHMEQQKEFIQDLYEFVKKNHPQVLSEFKQQSQQKDSGNGE